MTAMLGAGFSLTQSHSVGLFLGSVVGSAVVVNEALIKLFELMMMIIIVIPFARG